jgi:RNA polymerase primary sigma factor
LLTREGEVAIAKRIERGQIKTNKAISRSPIAVAELLKMGEELAELKLNIREVVTFSEQAELAGEEDKADEYRSGRSKASKAFNKIFKNALKESVKLRTETKITRGKKTKKLLRLRGKVSRLRIEISTRLAV